MNENKPKTLGELVDWDTLEKEKPMITRFIQNEQFHAGMIAYEQLCEQVLDISDISDEGKMFIQTQILDAAQNAFEKWFIYGL